MTGEPGFDAVIAGGGLGGLSLVARLATTGWSGRSVLLVDDGSPGAAESWGYWSAVPGLFDRVASRSYRQVRVHAGGSSRVVGLGRYEYRVIHRRDLHRCVMCLLASCPGFSVKLGHVDEIDDGPNAARVVVDGRPVRATWAFDSVIGRQPNGAADALLAFTGHLVRCARPVFDPATPVLMDFRTPQRDGARFVYVLPDDPHQALVELTEFVPRLASPPSDQARERALEAYLRDVLGCAGHQVLRREAAVLPLRSCRAPRRNGRVLAIGARAGLVKASTGYAFQRIQRDSEAIAASLARHGHPFDLPRPRRRYRLLDAVLLTVLDRDPAELERAFARLFKRNPADRVLRFLDEESTLDEDLRLIASLPPGPYLRAALERRSRGGRS